MLTGSTRQRGIGGVYATVKRIVVALSDRNVFVRQRPKRNGTLPRRLYGNRIRLYYARVPCGLDVVSLHTRAPGGPPVDMFLYGTSIILLRTGPKRPPLFVIVR